MKSSPSKDLARIGDLLEEKIKAFQEFLYVTEALYDRLREKDSEGISSLICQRQDWVRHIGGIDGKISEWRRENPFPDEILPDILKDRLDFLFQTLRDLLQKTAERDRQCLAQAEFLREETKKELLTLRENWKATHQYIQRAGFPPRFMDVRG